MVSATLKIENKLGLHARPASLLIETAKQFQCVKELEKEGKVSDLKGIFSILKLQCKYSDTVVFSCNGEDEQACLAAITSLIKCGFDEE